MRFAIVGCGRIAQQHAKHIHTFGELVATCDVMRDRAEAIADTYSASPYGSLDHMLTACAEKTDVVSVCTPNGLHARHTIAALRAGCHVLCEKPMALTVADCGEMIKEAERANRRLFIVKQNRYNPPVQAVKQLLDEGRLGQVHSVHLNCLWNRGPRYYEDTWKGTRDLDGGCLFTQFSHFIDLLYWFFGDVSQVRAFVANAAHQNIIDFEDNGVVAMTFDSGTVGSIHFTINAYQQNMEGSLTIFGEHGTIKIGGQYLNELEYQRMAGDLIQGLPEGRKPNEYGHYTGSMSNHDEVYENVVDVLTKEGVITTNGFEGLKTVEIIQRIYASACSSQQPMAPTSPYVGTTHVPFHQV